MRPVIEVLGGYEALTRRAAELFCAWAGEGTGPFRVALSGGRTPRALYEALAGPFRERVPWPRLRLFWGDERCVAAEDSRSNYRMAREAMLDRAPLSPSQIFRVEAERPPAEAARRYEETLKREFELADGERPRFDLILLGVGEQGHTASLFPGSPGLAPAPALVLDVSVEAEPPRRITFTLPVLNGAARVLFLVCGADKAGYVRSAIEGSRPAIPAGSVRPADGELRWLLDSAAAGQLKAR